MPERKSIPIGMASAMRRTTRLIAVLALALPVAAGTIRSAGAAAPRGTCSERKAQFAIGQPYTSALATRVTRAAGARALRKIEPGGAYTMDFSPDRLNIEVDRRGRVVRATCG